MCEAAVMSGHTYTHTYIHTYIHTHDNYYNPRCAHAHRGLITGLKISIMGATLAVAAVTIYIALPHQLTQL